MTHVALTGANGFLGWHTRCALRSENRDVHSVPVGSSFDLASAASAIEKCQRVIHIAGINRGPDDQVLSGNIQFAEQVASALLAAKNPPRTVVFANSIQAGNGSVYGVAKARAAEVLFRAAEVVGAEFLDVKLPNLFGEYGRPFYNSVIATFSHLLASGGEPAIDADKSLELLHAQDAADILIGSSIATERTVLGESVSSLLAKLTEFSRLYRGGDIPDISSTFHRDLFNTYRSHIFPDAAQLKLTRRVDDRGSFFEVVRAHGGEGQTSFSTTVPGISRGDHFHRRKIERFAVLSGEAVISLRKLFTREVIDFPVSGDSPTAIDMPTMWAHKITNTGDSLLSTSFWSNEIFDPESPDTHAEAV